MKALLLDGPLFILRGLWWAYWVLIATLSVLCLLAALLTWLGVLPVGRLPEPLPSRPVTRPQRVMADPAPFPFP